MTLLGNAGSLYMVILMLLLIIGLGLMIKGFFTFLAKHFKMEANKNNTSNGGLFMQNNGWIKLAIFSFVGILVAFLILSFVAPGGMYGNTMYGHGTMQMNGAGTMGGMQVQGGMSGMGRMNVSMPMSGMGVMTDANAMIIYQLNQMQMQINQLQQQINMMNSAGMGGMGGMPSGSNMGGMTGGGMGMMNMGGMGGMSGGGGMGMMNMGGASGGMGGSSGGMGGMSMM